MAISEPSIYGQSPARFHLVSEYRQIGAKLSTLCREPSHHSDKSFILDPQKSWHSLQRQFAANKIEVIMKAFVYFSCVVSLLVSHLALAQIYDPMPFPGPEAGNEEISGRWRDGMNIPLNKVIQGTIIPNILKIYDLQLGEGESKIPVLAITPEEKRSSSNKQSILDRRANTICSITKTHPFVLGLSTAYLRLAGGVN